MTHCWGAAEWRANHPNCNPLFRLPFISILSLCYDLMHCKHLGCDMYFLGSVLWLLAFRVLAGEPQDNLSRVLGHCRDWWKEHGFSDVYRNMKVSMIGVRIEAPMESFPKLKGRAAEVKNLLFPMVHVWTRYMDPANNAHKEILLALQMSVRIEEILSANVKTNVFPRAVHAEFETCIFGFLALQTSVANHYNNLGYCLFNVTIKSHMMAHIAKDSKYLNPRRGWCYSGEHFMAHMKKLAASCCKGNRANQVSSKMLAKYKFAMHIKMLQSAAV